MTDAKVTNRWARRRNSLVFVCVGLLLVFGIWAWPVWTLRELPDVAEPFAINAYNQIDLLPEDNAYFKYVEAVTLLPSSPPLPVGAHTRTPFTWSRVDPGWRQWVGSSGVALAIWRQGTARPSAVYYQPAELLMRTQLDVDVATNQLANLGLLEATRHLELGDPATAWEWLRAGLRCSCHLSQNGCAASRILGARLYVRFDEAVEAWAADARLTPELRARALREFRALDRLTPTLAHTVRLQYYVYRNTLADQTERVEMKRTAPGNVAAAAFWPWETNDHLREYLANEPDLSWRVARLVFSNWLEACAQGDGNPRVPPMKFGNLPLFDIPVGGVAPADLAAWWARSTYARLGDNMLDALWRHVAAESAARQRIESALQPKSAR